MTFPFNTAFCLPDSDLALEMLMRLLEMQMMMERDLSTCLSVVWYPICMKVSSILIHTSF